MLFLWPQSICLWLMNPSKWCLDEGRFHPEVCQLEFARATAANVSHSILLRKKIIIATVVISVCKIQSSRPNQIGAFWEMNKLIVLKITSKSLMCRCNLSKRREGKSTMRDGWTCRVVGLSRGGHTGTGEVVCWTLEEEYFTDIAWGSFQEVSFTPCKSLPDILEPFPVEQTQEI